MHELIHIMDEFRSKHFQHLDEDYLIQMEMSNIHMHWKNLDEKKINLNLILTQLKRSRSLLTIIFSRIIC